MEVTEVKRVGQISIFVDTVVDSACREGASDIHIDSTEVYTSIKFRVFGKLKEFFKITTEVTPEIISRIKILSRLRIDVHDRGQDGRFSFNFGGENIDIRVSIVPAYYSESVVLRLLRPERQKDMNFSSLGFTQEEILILEKILSVSRGIILVTGATGSGKTTTIYALINRLLSAGKNIVTIEDPVEYVIHGVRQLQVHEKYFTFADGLRSVLRQDPEVIVVGEIRDPETAGLAFRAALTGHLVIASLHANSVGDIDKRLIDLGISTSLLPLVSLAISQYLTCVHDTKGNIVGRTGSYTLVEQSHNLDY